MASKEWQKLGMGILVFPLADFFIGLVWSLSALCWCPQGVVNLDGSRGSYAGTHFWTQGSPPFAPRMRLPPFVTSLFSPQVPADSLVNQNLCVLLSGTNGTTNLEVEVI